MNRLKKGMKYTFNANVQKGGGARLAQRKKQRRGTQKAAREGCFCVAHPKGFEPLTYRLGGGRSILLSYGCL